LSTGPGRHAVTVLLVVVALAAILTLTAPSLPQTNAQTVRPPRTVTVYIARTVYVSRVQTVYVARTVYVATAQTVSVFLYYTILQTLSPIFTGVSLSVSTFTNASFTTVVTVSVTETAHVSGLITEISVVSGMVTQTATVTAPFQIGPLSLDLADAGGLKFLAFTGAIALAGLIGGALVGQTRGKLR
jgi:hypothetical protein